MYNNPNVKVVKSEALSTRKKEKFVIIDITTGEVLEDAQGHGFRSVRTANAFWRTISKHRERKEQKQNAIANGEPVALQKRKKHGMSAEAWIDKYAHVLENMISDLHLVQIWQEEAAKLSTVVRPEEPIKDEVIIND